jgi:membrane-associated HD superfamily phosphohydrolase|tara:strand:+ start:274 stop:993 length:720 start_codon:yes stop_codon:yes gene_type:complete
VTQENVEEQSVLDQDQAQLDAVQEEPAPQTTPTDAVTKELQALREEMSRQVAGLQSKVDKGLNAIRRDTEEQAKQQQEAAIQQYLEQVPEEHRETFRAIANQNMQYREQISKLENGTTPEEPQVSSEWEQIYAIPRSMGLDPQTPGIDYAAFTDAGLTENQRRDRFFASIKTVMSSNTQTQTPATPQTTEQVQSPPTSGTPTSGSPSNLRSEEQIQRAYIEGKLTKEEYQQRLTQVGQR